MWNLEKIDKFEKLHNWFCTNNTNLQQQIYKNYRTNQPQINDNVTEIARWFQSVPEIPEDGQDKEFIEMMLKRNKFQVERTKLKIQHYFATIPKFGEIFLNLGHNRLCNEVVFSLPLPELNQYSERIVIFKINKNIGGTIDIKQAILTIITAATLGFHYDQALRLRFVLDFNGFEFMQFLKVRPNVIFMILEILERILSVSIAGIEIINSPFYMNLILALFKMTMKPKLLSRITVHKSLDSLHQTIPAQYLPVGYGSNPVIIEDLCREFDEIIQGSQEFYEKIASFVVQS